MKTLLRERRIALFFGGYAFSQLGYGMSLLVLPLLTLGLTHSAPWAGAVAAIEAAPQLLFGLVAGALADRGNLRRLLVGADIIAGLAVFALALLAWRTELSVAAILACASVTATATVFRDSGMFGAIRLLAGSQHASTAASLIQTTGAVAAIVGPVGGSLLVSRALAPVALLLDGLSYWSAAIGSAGLWQRLRTRTAISQRSLKHDIALGWRTLWNSPPLRHLTLLVAGGSVTGGAVVALITPLIVASLAVGPRSAEVGFVVAAGNVGGLLGAAFMPKMARRCGAGNLAIATVAGISVIAIIMPSLSIPLLFAGMYALWQVMFTLMITNGISIRLQVAPAHLVARVAMTARMIAWGAQPIGGFTAAGLAAIWGPGGAVRAAACVAALAAVGAVASRTGSVVERYLKAQPATQEITR